MNQTRDSLRRAVKTADSLRSAVKGEIRQLKTSWAEAEEHAKHLESVLQNVIIDRDELKAKAEGLAADIDNVREAMEGVTKRGSIGALRARMNKTAADILADRIATERAEEREESRWLLTRALIAIEATPARYRNEYQSQIIAAIRERGEGE